MAAPYKHGRLVSRTLSNEKRRVQRALYRKDHPLSPRSVNKIKKQCLYCGTEFWVFPCLARIECCSRKCKYQILGARLSGPRGPKLPRIRACGRCGKVAELLRNRCRECVRAESREAMSRRRLDPIMLERLRAQARENAKRTQSDPERRSKRNLRQREVSARRRALEHGSRVARISYRRVVDIYGMACSICGDPIDQGNLSFDHVIPLCRGGSHTEDNLRPAHLDCNRKKNRRLPEEMNGLR